MKVKHVVYSDQNDLDNLLTNYKAACLAAYATAAEQEAAIKAAEAELSIKLDTLLQKAFKVGKKISKSKLAKVKKDAADL